MPVTVSLPSILSGPGCVPSAQYLEQLPTDPSQASPRAAQAEDEFGNVLDADSQVCRDGCAASPHLDEISINDPVLATLSISPKAAVAATLAPLVRLKTYSR
jgi:hypothetical protein